MAHCTTCDEPVKQVRKFAWAGVAGAERTIIYGCNNLDCPNEGGRVWTTESGSVVKAVGVTL